MICFVKLPALKETFKNKNHRPEFWVFFLQEFYQLHTVDTVGTIEGNVYIDVSLPVLEFDQRHFGVL
jgi:hypothetical protein